MNSIILINIHWRLHDFGSEEKILRGRPGRWSRGAAPGDHKSFENSQNVFKKLPKCIIKDFFSKPCVKFAHAWAENPQEFREILEKSLKKISRNLLF